jgi:hypothetical protein
VLDAWAIELRRIVSDVSVENNSAVELLAA